VEEVSAAGLEAAIAEGGPVLVDVYADWCGPCKLMEPVLEALQVRMEGLRVLRMDSEAYESKATAMRVHALPTLVFYKAGAEVHRFEGALDLESLEELASELFGLQRVRGDGQQR